MRPLPFRRRGLPMIALSVVFFALAASTHRNAYVAVGACFLIAGIILLRRGRGDG